MLVPMYFIIGIWGGARRIYAAMKFFLFTMAGSLLMFLAILYLAIRHAAATGDVVLRSRGPRRDCPSRARSRRSSSSPSRSRSPIKVPVFPLHTWLPDAHTEAPTAGSIILAGVLLKLGVYGYLRFALPLFPDAAMRFAPWLGVLGVIGVIYGALVACAQKDMKRLVAYSSVSHLGLVVIGIGAFTTISLAGLDPPDGQPRALDRRALPARRRALRAAPHAGDRGVRRDRGHRARHDGALPHRDASRRSACPGLNGFVGEFLILLGTWTSAHRVVGDRGGDRRHPLRRSTC